MFEQFTTMEKQLCEQDILINSLSRKVNNLETNLALSEETVKKIVEKVQDAVM